MTPTLQNILTALDEIAPFEHAEEWDNSGLQVGSLSQEISRIYVALDPTMEAARNAAGRGAQLLLTHHPLIYKPLFSINQQEYPGDIIYFASRKKISIVAAHTNLDISNGGINDILAGILKLDKIRMLEEDNRGSGNIGIGRIGELKEPLALSRVTEIVKENLYTGNVMVSGHRDKVIKSVAVVGGSGGDLVSTAAQKGADLLITGDIKHHKALEAETLGLALIDGGHFYTEKAALKVFSERFRDKLSDKGWDIDLEFHDGEKNPLRFG